MPPDGVGADVFVPPGATPGGSPLPARLVRHRSLSAPLTSSGMLRGRWSDGGRRSWLTAGRRAERHAAAHPVVRSWPDPDPASVASAVRAAEPGGEDTTEPAKRVTRDVAQYGRPICNIADLAEASAGGRGSACDLAGRRTTAANYRDPGSGRAQAARRAARGTGRRASAGRWRGEGDVPGREGASDPPSRAPVPAVAHPLERLRLLVRYVDEISSGRSAGSRRAARDRG